MSTENKSFAVLPTADAPTAEQMHLALDSAIGRAISADTVKVLSWVNAHLPSLIAADADRQRLEYVLTYSRDLHLHPAPGRQSWITPTRENIDELRAETAKYLAARSSSPTTAEP